MNHAFSAKRQASRKSGTPWRSQTERTPRRFSRETGWPPPELFVTVTNTTGTSPAALDEERLERLRVHVALEGCSDRRIAALGDHEVDGFGTGDLDVRARRVEVRVVRDDLARPRRSTANRIFSAARPWCVGITCWNGNSSCTASRNTNHEGDPA